MSSAFAEQQAARVSAPAALSRLGVNVFTAP